MFFHTRVLHKMSEFCTRCHSALFLKGLIDESLSDLPFTDLFVNYQKN